MGPGCTTVRTTAKRTPAPTPIQVRGPMRAYEGNGEFAAACDKVARITLNNSVLSAGF
jgi:hypothetical protein